MAKPSARVAKPSGRVVKPSAGADAARRRRGAGATNVVRRAIVVALALALAAGIAYAAVKLSADPRLALGDVAVIGAQRTGADTVLGAAALPSGRNIWLLETAGAERRVAALPWVASDKIQRAWPNRVSITVSERVAVARLSLDASSPGAPYALVDGQGRVLESGSDQPADAQLTWLVVRPLPPDAGTSGAQLGSTAVGDGLDALRRFGDLGVRMTEIEVDPITGISAITLSNVRVMFGGVDDLTTKLALFDAIAKRITRPQDIAYVDVRSTSAPTVQYRR
jgi:cell division septal protein FtsQ